jgi:hypothetical protein
MYRHPTGLAELGIPYQQEFVGQIHIRIFQRQGFTDTQARRRHQTQDRLVSKWP